MAVLTEMPITRVASTCETASRIASSTPSAMASGSWMCQPGWGLSSGYSRDAVSRTFPSSENADAPSPLSSRHQAQDDVVGCVHG